MKYRLGELIESISKTYDLKNKESVTFVNTGDVFDGSISGNETKIKDLPGQAKKSIELNDILFSEIRPRNKRFALVTGIDPKNYVVSTKLMVLRNKNNLVLDTNYLYFYLTSPLMLAYFQSEAESRSGTFPQITFRENVANIKIDLPPLIEQRKIVQRLSVINDKVKLNNQINDNLISLATTLFNKYFPNINSGNEMIGNFISNYDRLRKPLSKKERLSIPGKYRYIGATSVNDYINKYNFDGIYLLLGEDGTVEDDNGYPILQYISGKFWPNNHAHVLQGKNVSTEWLYLFFKQRKITSIVTGAVQKKISQKNLNSLSISIPDKDKLARFDTIINPIFKNIRIIKSENHSLEKIKVELLSKLF